MIMRYIVLLLLASSCSTALYVPNTRNTPLFREQGEAQVSAYLGAAGLEAQGAYALTDHLAAIEARLEREKADAARATAKN